MAACPCGSGVDGEACCRPILDGAPAPTALALMRSRYAAYVTGAIEHVIATTDATTRGQVDRAAVTKWSRDTRWLGLEILDVVRGGPTDDDGVVEFVARGVTGDAPFAQRERSRFRRDAGRWFYLDGTLVPVRAVASAGRNDPCPCGSGLKYKRCHGA